MFDSAAARPGAGIVLTVQLARAVTWLALLSTARCGGQDPHPSAHDSVAAVQDSGAACSAIRRRPDGTCCPAASVFDANAAACLPAGPRGCKNPVDAPDSCWPDWCFTWRTLAGNACAPTAEDCLALPIECTATAHVAGQCPAGWHPRVEAGQACVPAGLWYAGDPTPQDGSGAGPPAVPAVRSPPGVPGVEPLPPLAATRFCHGANPKNPVVCTPGAAPCPNGQAPHPEDPSACVAVGVPWLCPDGFVLASEPDDAQYLLPTCVPDPNECAVAPYRGLPAAANVVYVDAAAVAKGDGTKGKPYASLAIAVDNAASGSILALAPGTYTPPAVIKKSVTLAGMCAEKVRLTGSDGLPRLAVKQTYGQAPGTVSVAVTGVQFVGDGPAVEVTTGARLRLERVYVGAARTNAVLVLSRAHLEFVNSVVARTGPQAGTAGVGLALMGTATAALDSVRITRTVGDGISLGLQSAVTARALMVDGSRPGPKGLGAGAGVASLLGAQAHLVSSRIADNSGIGVVILGQGSRATLHAAVVDETRPSGGDDAAALSAGTEGELDLRATRVVHSGTALSVWGGARATVRGLLVGPGTHDVVAKAGVVAVATQAQLDADSVRIALRGYTGIYASGGSIVRARHVAMTHDGTELPDAEFGEGACVSSHLGAQLHLTGAHLRQCRQLALMAGSGSLFAKDVVVDGVLPAADPDFGVGIGLGALANGSLVASSVRITGAVGVAFLVNAGEEGKEPTQGRVHVSGLLVDHTQTVHGGKSTALRAATVLAGSTSQFGFAGNRLDGTPLHIRRAATAGGTVRFAVHGTLFEGEPGATNGEVLYASAGTEVDVATSLAERGLGAAMRSHDAKLTLRDTVVRNGVEAKVSLNGKVVTIADAVVASQCPDLRFERGLLHGQARAGMLLDAVAKSRVSASLITANGIGVASQHSAPIVMDGTAVWGNTTVNVLTDQGLPLPPLPPTVPVPGAGGP